MKGFKLIIVEDVPLELKGTEGIIRNEIPEAEVIGTADNEATFWRLIKQQQHEVGLLFLDEPPIGHLVGSSTDDVCLGNLVANYTFRAFEFEGHVLDDNKFKLVHDILVI